MEINPIFVEIAEGPDHSVTKHEASVSKKEAEFNTKNTIVEDNKVNSSYEIKVFREEYKQMTYHYSLQLKQLQCNQRLSMFLFGILSLNQKNMCITK